MLSELLYSCLEKEIQFLRLDLNGLAVELNIQQIYHTLYNPAVTDRIEGKTALYIWKKIRLEALELFARAQYVITEMRQPAPAPAQLTRTNHTMIYKRKRRPKNKTRDVGLSGNPKLDPVPQNMVERDSNKEKQGPSSTQPLISQVRTDTVKNEKNEDVKEIKIIPIEDSKRYTIADTLKILKKENIDYDQISVLNNNINANFIPRLLPVASVKVEGVDCNIVKNEANEGRKRKRRSKRRSSKRFKTE